MARSNKAHFAAVHAGALTDGDGVVADTSVVVFTTAVDSSSSLSLLVLISGRSASACAPRL